MLRPSLYFPDFPKPGHGIDRLCADRSQSAVNSTRTERHAQNLQRVVLPSGCVLIQLGMVQSRVPVESRHLPKDKSAGRGVMVFLPDAPELSGDRP